MFQHTTIIAGNGIDVADDSSDQLSLRFAFARKQAQCCRWDRQAICGSFGRSSCQVAPLPPSMQHRMTFTVSCNVHLDKSYCSIVCITHHGASLSGHGSFHHAR